MNFSLIPSWVYWLIIAALAGVVGVERIQVANAKSALANEQKARAQDTINRQEIAILRSKELRALESTHAATQQETVNVYETKLIASKAVAVTERARADRMQRDLSSYTASGNRPGETDAIACQRAQDRLPRVGALLAEGVRLEAEGRELIRQRDTEVDLLLGQIKADRAACSPTK